MRQWLTPTLRRGLRLPLAKMICSCSCSFGIGGGGGM